MAEYIVSSYAAAIVTNLRTLYARREVQCEPQALQRWMLNRARDEAASVSPSYGGGGPLVQLVIGGAALPVLGWLAQAVGAVAFGDWCIFFCATLLLVLVFVASAFVLLQGAGIAHRRSRMIMAAPLAALWETIGHCGTPPEDDSRTFALIALVLTGLVWFALPAVLAIMLLLT